MNLLDRESIVLIWQSIWVLTIEPYPGPEDFGLKTTAFLIWPIHEHQQNKVSMVFCRKIGPGLPKVPRQHQIDLLYWLHHRSIALATMLQEPRPGSHDQNIM